MKTLRLNTPITVNNLQYLPGLHEIDDALANRWLRDLPKSVVAEETGEEPPPRKKAGGRPRKHPIVLDTPASTVTRRKPIPGGYRPNR